MELKKHEVPVDGLCGRCDPRQFKFDCTKDLGQLQEFISQDRAIRAIEFGLNMKNDGYNMYVAGLTGTGKTTIVKSYIEKVLKDRQAELYDWCYTHNLQDPDRPSILSVPQGKGKILQGQVFQLLNQIKDELGKTFASEEYKTQRQKTVEQAQSEQHKLFEELQEEARKAGFFFQVTPTGPLIIPMVDGRPMEESEFLTLDQSTRRDIENRQMKIRKKLEEGLEKAGLVAQKAAQKLREADKNIGEFTISRLFSPLLSEYSALPLVSRFLDNLKSYTLDNLDSFKGTEEAVHPLFGVPVSQVTGRNPFLPFQINVFVDNSDVKGAPVVTEPNPNFGNMFGKIERRFLFGGYLSDHTMLKAGAVSRASGGYLLLSAVDVLTNPGVWPALKRAIKNREVRIEDPFEQFGLFPAQGMKPEPMPIDVKFIMIGDAMLYQMLAMYDEDFWEIFKVKADFSHEIERNEKNVKDYAAFIAGCCEQCKARHFDPSGVARVVEYSSRLVEDQEKLSSRFAQIKELVEESNYWAGRDKAEHISARHVQKAVEEKIFRHNLVQEHIQDMIRRGSIMIDVDGAVVGQVNGLSIFSFGDITFGKPSRITAKTFLGRSGIVNIEREAQLSGPIHNKGVLILSGYLGWKYAQEKPLSLSASLCFEQSYEGVEGDSASSTELYAILSSLSEMPIRQSIAITGSVNQRGEIQPIGGVNQKIEGFFEVCRAKGLTGEQGVLIPEKNLKNLMLREEIIDAARKGQFHIYAVRTIDEGIEVLTGVPAGERQVSGLYLEGTVNYLVDKQLKIMAERLRSFAAEGRETAKG